MYLTFDDGPVYGTQTILEVVEEVQVPVAMFFIGEHIIRNKRNQAYYEQAKQNPLILIGNHTHTHAKGRYRNFYSKEPSHIVEDIKKTHEILSQDGLTQDIPYTRLAGRNVFRLPSIEKNDIFISQKQSLEEIDGYDAVWNEGFFLYGWDYEWEFDYKNKKPSRSVDELVSIIERLYKSNKTTKDGKFVLLMHDQMFKERYNGKENLIDLITKLKNNGWEFDSLANYLTPNDFLYATNMPKEKATSLQKLATNKLQLPQPKKTAQYTASLKQQKIQSTPTPKEIQKEEIKAVEVARTPVKVDQKKIENKEPKRIASQSSVQKMPYTKEQLISELFSAIKNTDEQRIIKALKNGADIYSFNESGQSPLVLATTLKQSNIVQILINHGADINHKDKNGDSAISVLQRMTR